MKAELIKEIDNEIANVKWFKIPATKTAVVNGYKNCIEKHSLYKEANVLTITRHMCDDLKHIMEVEDVYFETRNGKRVSLAKA